MMLILASASPQRREILKRLGLDFRAVPAELDEQSFAEGYQRPFALVRRLALEKALAVAKSFPEDWVIGSDTLVACQGQILEKPKDRKDADRMLRLCRGSSVRIYSGLALVNLSRSFRQAGFQKTTLVFHEFPQSELARYLDSGAWQGKSGAMTIEDCGRWIRRQEGEHWNVVGLPVALLRQVLMSGPWNPSGIRPKGF